MEWKNLSKTLPIGSNLLARGLSNLTNCIHCGELEAANHLLLHCEFSRQVWMQAPFKFSIDSSMILDLVTGIKASKTWICAPPTGVSSGHLFPWICWAIWAARNHFLFENRVFSPSDTITKAVREAIKWQMAQMTEKPFCQQDPYRMEEPTLDSRQIICQTGAA
ncbi:uncharacterized protein LOC112084411 [Eutrema salsugineum]|uniref:uncharacterized protein LOC112084411 n=1 Tax=Eutrema salsugineum TaxID=72664 RepID=UPI000CECE4B1|nr:uncharacterized protein LOC112084411 [Eutrema salsugineum]